MTGQIADALNYAGKQGIVHRDIKPANIMLLKNGTVKVTDFGIARVVESSKTQTGVILGTPSYMSPEQVIGKKVDNRSDLFSLGVMLYEMLSGKKPFTGDSIATLMYNIANQPHPPLKEVMPNAPQCCAVIVDRFLAKDIEKRYQNGAQAVKDLKACYMALGKKK
jgi:serine/threonine-protein kinase